VIEAVLARHARTDTSGAPIERAAFMDAATAELARCETVERKAARVAHARRAQAKDGSPAAPPTTLDAMFRPSKLQTDRLAARMNAKFSPERLYRLHEANLRRREAQREQRDRAEMEQCTFAPQTRAARLRERTGRGSSVPRKAATDSGLSPSPTKGAGGSAGNVDNANGRGAGNVDNANGSSAGNVDSANGSSSSAPGTKGNGAAPSSTVIPATRVSPSATAGVERSAIRQADAMARLASPGKRRSTVGHAAASPPRSPHAHSATGSPSGARTGWISGATLRLSQSTDAEAQAQAEAESNNDSGFGGSNANNDDCALELDSVVSTEPGAGGPPSGFGAAGGDDSGLDLSISDMGGGAGVAAGMEQQHHHHQPNSNVRSQHHMSPPHGASKSARTHRQPRTAEDMARAIAAAEAAAEIAGSDGEDSEF
jgi:hypothetical protein